MENITVEDVIFRIVRGAEAIIENKEYINEINVFPVPDADTGSNMAATFVGVKKASEHSKNIDDILNAALISSQGNSGIMVTAYLSGFLDKLKNKKIIDNKMLAYSFKSGFEASSSSVENPKNGTMLDVMEAFYKSYGKNNIDESLNIAKESLKNTEKKMDVLSKNHVVDAGALGFVIFLFAFFDKKFDLSEIDIHKVETKKLSFGEFPYEVVFIAKNCSFAKAEIEKMFHPLGDSIDIVEIEKKFKVHIHTNEPKLVEQTAELLGSIESIKTVDMRINGGHN